MHYFIGLLVCVAMYATIATAQDDPAEKALLFDIDKLQKALRKDFLKLSVVQKKMLIIAKKSTGDKSMEERLTKIENEAKENSEVDKSLEERLTNMQNEINAMKNLGEKKAAFSVYPSQNGITLTNHEVVPFNTVISDPWNKFDTTKYEYVIPISGYYVFTMCINHADYGPGFSPNSEIDLVVNDVILIGDYTLLKELPQTSSTLWAHDQGCNSAIKKCDVGDIVKARSDGSSNIRGVMGGTITPVSTLSGFLLYPIEP